VSFGWGNIRLPVDGLTVELSLVSDALLMLSSDSTESAERITHRRFTNGLLSEPWTVECTKYEQYNINISYWNIIISFYTAN